VACPRAARKSGTYRSLRSLQVAAQVPASCFFFSRRRHPLPRCVRTLLAARVPFDKAAGEPRVCAGPTRSDAWAHERNASCLTDTVSKICSFSCTGMLQRRLMRSHFIVGALSMAVCQWDSKSTALATGVSSLLWWRVLEERKNPRHQLLQTLPCLAVSCAASGGQCSFGDVPS
jgi:hypothetical protein